MTINLECTKSHGTIHKLTQIGHQWTQIKVKAKANTKAKILSNLTFNL